MYNLNYITEINTLIFMVALLALGWKHTRLKGKRFCYSVLCYSPDDNGSAPADLKTNKATRYYFLIIQLAMDDVSSETCFVFIKKYRKNELQKHRVVHQSDKYVYMFCFVLFCFGFFFVGLFFLSCFCFCCGEKVWIRLDQWLKSDSQPVFS